MSANNEQVGGEHYKSQYQHWDYVADVQYPYLLSQITRYVARWRKKNGAEDVKKAIHYTTKLIEQVEASKQKFNSHTLAFARLNALGLTEVAVFDMLGEYHTGQQRLLFGVRTALQELLRNNQPSLPAEDPEFLNPSDEWRKD